MNLLNTLSNCAAIAGFNEKGKGIRSILKKSSLIYLTLAAIAISAIALV